MMLMNQNHARIDWPSNTDIPGSITGLELCTEPLEAGLDGGPTDLTGEAGFAKEVTDFFGEPSDFWGEVGSVKWTNIDIQYYKAF